jgi:hypothetical protein
MKKLRFLFVTVGCGILTLGLSHAGEPSSKPAGKDSTEPHLTKPSPAGKDQAARRPPLLRDFGHPAPLEHAQVKQAPANQLHPPLKKASPVANGGLMSHTLAARPEPLAKSLESERAAMPSLSGVRSRTATTASLGGLTPPKTAVALNGTTMKRKP